MKGIHTRMTDNIFTGTGVANWIVAPDRFLVDSTPGALNAESEWLTINDAASTLRARRRSADLALIAAREDGTTAQIEAAERAARKAEAALSDNSTAAKRALQRLDRILRTADRSPADTAAIALAKHTEAEDAYATFIAALDSRDRAYRASGFYGRRRAGADSGYTWADEGPGYVLPVTIHAEAVRAGRAALDTFNPSRVATAIANPELEAQHIEAAAIPAETRAKLGLGAF